MNNRWNKFIYRIGSTIYDRLFNAGNFLKARKQLFSNDLLGNEQQCILFVGVGTGADLEQLDTTKYDITAIDYSEAMLNKAKDKFKHSSIQFLIMDAQEMKFPDKQFDLVVASLILSVVPNDEICFKEIIRVLKPGGRILIFDKFAPEGNKLPLLKRILRPVIQVLGTDIGRNFEALYKPHREILSIQEDRPLLFNGMYRKIILQKNS